MENYCRSTGCLRNYILEYFGEKTGAPCDNCGNCHREYKEVDMTAEAKWVINCLAETKGRYGLNIVIGTLLGANRVRLKELGTIYYRSYGQLSQSSENDIRLLISQMILDGYICQTEEQYSVLRIGDITRLKDENTHVLIRMYKEKEPEQNKKSRNRKSTDSLTRAGYVLFEKLRALRTEIAREEAMPPYIIFSDKTLIDMCVKVPQNKDQMLNVSGVGAAKFDKYGSRFLQAILSFQDIHPDSVISISENEEGEAEPKPVKTKKKSKKKTEFYLEESDAGNFKFSDLYYISDIKDELNRITTAENAKKVTVTAIWGYLVSEGYTEESDKDGGFVKIQTEKGLTAGIQTIEKVSTNGNPYTLLMYPENIQKLLVNHFVDIKETVLDMANDEIDEVDRAVINRLNNRPEEAGSAWTDEEDEQVKQEFASGLAIKEIAEAHRRTKGAIRARLKKHGLIY